MANGLASNPGKTQLRVFALRCTAGMADEFAVFLEISLDSRLLWQPYMDRIAGFSTSTIYLLRNMKGLVHMNIHLSAYSTSVQSPMLRHCRVGHSAVADKVFALQ